MKAAIAVLLFAGVTLYGIQQTTFPPPPKELRETERMWNKKWAEPTNGLSGHAAYFTTAKKFTMTWRHSSGVGASQDIALPFYPTAICRNGMDVIYVAGRNQKGQTVVHAMTYTPPTVTVGGGGAVSIGNAVVTNIDVLYHEATTGRDMIRFMRPTLFDSTKLLIQFWDSRDLYLLDTTSGAYTKVASSTASPGVLQVPSIQDHFDMVWFAEHVAYGYVYVLGSAKHDVNALIIYDMNKDGVFDGFLSIPKSQWATSGFESAVDFVRFD